MEKTETADSFFTLSHQGKILENLILKKNLTPAIVAKRLNISRGALKTILKSKELPGTEIANACSVLEVESTLFFPASKTTHKEQPDSEFEELKLKYQESLINLVQAKDEIINQKKAYEELQNEMIRLLKKINNQ